MRPARPEALPADKAAELARPDAAKDLKEATALPALMELAEAEASPVESVLDSVPKAADGPPSRVHGESVNASTPPYKPTSSAVLKPKPSAPSKNVSRILARCPSVTTGRARI